jgi:diguanylate cyclase (GGDEF)-like protein/PAS domain S-box-containing protein
MLRVYTCLTEQHDLRLILVAGIICLFAAFTAFTLFEQARSARRFRIPWIAAVSFVSGIGIWSTHFIAMLAFEPHLPVGYDPGLTLLSVLIAIVVTGFGWRLSLLATRWAPLLGGTVIGLGIGSMHYVGMSAVTLAGQFLYDQDMVSASILIGAALATVALFDHRRSRARFPWRPALLMTLAICGLHFTAMGAASILPDPRILVPEASIHSATLTTAVIAMVVIILACGFAAVMVDREFVRRAGVEAQRLKSFADAAVEGLVIVDGSRIADANRSFRTLAGLPSGTLHPGALAELLPDLESGTLELDRTVETRLRRPDGSVRDVEVLARPIEWHGMTYRVLAIRDVTLQKEAAARIAHLAYHDALTGLPNRTVFTESLVDAVRASDEVAVLCIDLDNFKMVNDLHGHPAGDELLVEVAKRLRCVIGPHEIAARLGGDEFAIVQTAGNQPHAADILAHRILAALGKGAFLGGRTVTLSCSIGVAIFPTDAATAIELAKNADMALYRAKREGRSSICFYESRMDDAVRDRRQLEADLQTALERGELDLHYQPLVALETGQTFGFEALMRWSHPARGDVPPSIFIPIAEECGFITRLGSWALETACREAVGWDRPLTVSVNLSPLQFRDRSLAEQVERTLRATGLAPNRLELEITEGVLIEDSARALETLRRLKALGVRIAMDDFGTGYSSLSYFRQFPFDKVKIDQSFVRDMLDNAQARAIVRSVIGLGRGLAMPVLAEGVETDEQLQALLADGCDQVQGFLISRPGPIGNFDHICKGAEGESAGMAA